MDLIPGARWLYTLVWVRTRPALFLLKLILWTL